MRAAALLLIPIGLTVGWAAEDKTDFPKTAYVGDVTSVPHEGILSACSVHVKISAKDLHLRERSSFGRVQMPSYPGELLAAGVTGEAEILFELDEKGRISNARLGRYSDKEFATSSLAAVRGWKPQPLKWIGDPKKVTATATFIFSIYFE